MNDAAPLLELDSLRVSFALRAGVFDVIPGVSLAIGRGEALGLVGESGSGKSTLAFAIVRYLGALGRITGGRILFEGEDITAADEARLRAIRGRRIAMVYQDPMSSLNPVMPVGRQLMEIPRLHEGCDAGTARARALDILAEVNFADPAAIMARYPHQLSGGQQQRVVIAMALIGRPSLLIMDEPTTGLDVTVEAAVLDLVQDLRRRHGTALLFISHNLGTVAQVCDRIAVLYAGEIVEEGRIADVFGNPAHPYTRGLLGSLPRLSQTGGAPLAPIPGQPPSLFARMPGCGFAPRCAHVQAVRCTAAPVPLAPVAGEAAHRIACARADELPACRTEGPGGTADAPRRLGAEELVRAEGLGKVYRQRRGAFGGRSVAVRALDGVELAARRGETLAIVGESGCGKSTFARVLAGLEVANSGSVRLGDAEIAARLVESRPRGLRRQLQMVFQNPDSTLNPSHSVAYAIGRAVRRLKGLSRTDSGRAVVDLLDAVRLSPDLALRRPHQLSGGQKQRVAIARALAGDPDLLIADEPVSALDVSVQATIINLLAELRARRGMTLIFISHDLAVVRHLADHVAVMYLGHVVEFGPADAVFAPPWHPYTEALLSAVPEPGPHPRRQRIILETPAAGEAPSPAGCPFAPRCPRVVGEICRSTVPPEQELGDGHRMACHIPAAELVGLQGERVAVQA